MRGGNQTRGSYHHHYHHHHRHRHHYYHHHFTTVPSLPSPLTSHPGPPPFYAALKVSCRANIVGCVAIGIIALKSKMVSRYTLFVIKILRIHSKIISRFIQTAARLASAAHKRALLQHHQELYAAIFVVLYTHIRACVLCVFLKGFHGGFLKGCQ